MTTLVLLHSALGRTSGMDAIAERFALAGYAVHTPDVYAGRTFDEIGRASCRERV